MYITVKPYPMTLNAEGKLLVDPQKMMNDGYGDIGKMMGFIIARFVEKTWIRFKSLRKGWAGILICLIGLIPVVLMKDHFRPVLVSAFGSHWGKLFFSIIYAFYYIAFFPMILKLIGRQHSAQQTIDAFKLAREAGFNNINMDIILGLPGETPEDVQYTIDVISDLRPDDLTVHSLAIKRASRLHKWIEKNGFTSINNTDESMEIAAKGAADMGMKPYYLYRQKNMSGNFENVGYALDGKAGIYNILIMEEKQSILALGAGPKKWRSIWTI